MDGDAGAGGDAGGDAAERAASARAGADGGVDYGWVMQVTFVVTVVAGAPLVAALSLAVALPTWEEKVAFAVRVGAAVWLVTGLSVYAYARLRR